MVFFFKCKQQNTSLIDNSVKENNTNAQGIETQHNNQTQNNYESAYSLQTLDQSFVVSTALPKESDIVKTAELVNFLKVCGVFKFEGTLNQELNITKLNFIVEQWIKLTLISRNTPRNIVENASAQLYIYGNYKLGVHDKEDHISILCDHSNFLMVQPEVTNLQTIQDEVIQMQFEGITVDVFFARLPFTELHKSINLQDEMVLKNVDVKCFNSLYGVRVTNQILQLIPNIDQFRLAVKAIKLWAKNNGVYGTTHGFLNDAAWTLLVTRICQSYPQAVAATVIQKFFLIFSNWKWPEPVFIKKLPSVNRELPAWDLNGNIQNKSDAMQIITPVHPQRNLASNVSYTTRKIMLNAFNFASQLTEQIMLGKESWDRLFHPSLFFMKYQHYVVLMVYAETYLDHLNWRRYIEDEVKRLIDILEKNPHIALVHLNPENFSHFKLNCNSQSGYSMWFIGLEFAKTNINLDLSYDLQNFTMETIQKARFSNIMKKGMDFTARRIKQEQLRLYIPSNIINFEKANIENVIEKEANGNSLFAERTVNKKETSESDEDDSDFKNCLKNHGYISLESESDDGKSESDDELRAMKPPALAYNDFKHRIIRIVDSNKPSIANIENQNGKIHSNKLNEKAITENTLLPTWFIDELLHDGKPVHKITSSKNEAVNWTQKTKGLKSQPETSESDEDDSDFKNCLKNHGYISLESESDDGKSESDDELRAMKPPALAYNDFKHRIIRIVDSNKPSIANIENQNGKIHSNKLNEKAITENTLLPTWFIDELLHDGKPVHKITSSKNEAVNWTQKTKGLKSQPVQNITNTTKHDPTSEKNHMNLLIGPNSILSKPNILPQFGAPILQQPYVRPYYLENTASNWNPYLIQLQQQINHQNAVRYRNITAAQNVLFNNK
ncbi:Poly(A) polymerase predicted RNA binding domain [Popillia japonica]|uniref:polynucleotide adenylyltransferase n=1 Tax=Popillia japonica TaxID=7064 RepID=A0AAW1IYG5_POPJA